MMINRTYARSAELNREKGGKVKKRVPAKITPKITAETGIGQTRPTPPRITITYAKNVVRGAKSGGLKNTNWYAKKSPAIAPIAAPMTSTWSLKRNGFFPSEAAASSSSRIERRTRPQGDPTARAANTSSSSAADQTNTSIVKFGSRARDAGRIGARFRWTSAWKACQLAS